jgi:hypothetical protein
MSTWVLNANTLAVSEYSISALDVMEYEGELYFVTATGLVKFAAEGAEKFSWSFSTGELGLVEESLGAITKLSLSGKFAGEVRLTVIAQEYGEETEVFYSMPCESTTVERGQHVALARDVHAEAWTFCFAGTEAAELHNVKVLVSAQTRAW